jgi:cysteine desulfurase / selenocysteine lyase
MAELHNDFSVTKLRADFPQINRKVNGKWPVYLDSAATALKPWSVIEKVGHHYSYETANVHRGAHYFADLATQQFESTREKVAQFLNAKSSKEIVFTSGTTDSINLVAQAWGRANVKAGDEVIISELEHHSNIVPWQMLCEEKGAHLKVIPVVESNGSFQLNLDEFKKLISPRTKLVAVTQCSNTLGVVTPINEIISVAHNVGAKVLVDGAQMVANHRIDLQKLAPDFFVFSAHKLFGPTGVGILYAPYELLNSMPPYRGGGSMISTVSFEKTTYNEAPYKFEAGTPDIANIIAFGASIDYVMQWNWEIVKEYEHHLVKLAYNKLAELPGVKILSPNPNMTKELAPILTFVVDKIHASDLGSVLNQEMVAVRVGHMCTQPLLVKLKQSSVARASLSIYNNEKDIETFISAVKKTMELFL